MACAPCPSTRLSAASPTAPPSPPIYAASGPSSTSHERGEVGCRWGLDAACGICTLRVFALEQSEQKKAHKEACRAPGFASPLPRPHSLPCALHTSTRVHSTLDTHAARMRASTATRTCTHTATCTCAHTRQKHHVVPRVTGHWLTVGRPAAEPSSAQSQRKSTRHISLLVSHVHHPHAVHATHHQQ